MSIPFLPFRLLSSSVSPLPGLRSAFIAAVAIFISASIASAQEPELSTEGGKDIVSAVLPYALDFVRNRIQTEFDSHERAFFEDYNGAIYMLPHGARVLSSLAPEERQKFIAFPIVRHDKFYVFYGAYKNMQHLLQEITPYSTLGVTNPALQRYAALSIPQRAHDIYLWSPDAPFWHSEYTSNGTTLPFRSYFIIHLSAVDGSHTSVEIIEDSPVVSMGRKLSVDTHGVVHHYDIRDVAPTTSDREFLLYCINQFIERQIPSRHVFNCLSKQEIETLKKKESERREIEKEVEEQLSE